MSDTAEIPISEAALRLGISRERAIRLVHIGAIQGGQRYGRWLADSRSIEEYLASQLAEELRCSTLRSES